MDCLNHSPRNQQKGKVWMSDMGILGIVHSPTWGHPDIRDAAAPKSLKHLEKGICVSSSCAPFDTPLDCIYRKSGEFYDLEIFFLCSPGKYFFP